MDEEDLRQKKLLEKSLVQNSYSEFDKELIRIAGKSEEAYNNFYHLLKQRKNVEMKKERQNIPINMGKRITTNFQGYSGLLVKTLADSADYKLITNDITLFDTKIVSKEYKNTTINDILYDLSINNGFNLVIKEKERVIVIKAEE